MEEYLTDEELEESEEDIEKLCEDRANKEFNELCVGPLAKINHALPYAKTSGMTAIQFTRLSCQLILIFFYLVDYRSTLAELIDLTQVVVARHVEGDVWIVSSMAQRASAQAKISSSIE